MHPLANRGTLGLTRRNLLLVRRRSTYNAAFAIGLHYFFTFGRDHRMMRGNKESPVKTRLVEWIGGRGSDL